MMLITAQPSTKPDPTLDQITVHPGPCTLVLNPTMDLIMVHHVTKPDTCTMVLHMIHVHIVLGTGHDTVPWVLDWPRPSPFGENCLKYRVFQNS